MEKTHLATKIAEGLIGHIAMPGVTNYVVDYINEQFEQKFEDTDEMVAYAQENHAEIEECPICGWYVDYTSTYMNEDEVEDANVVGCPDCLEDHEE